MPQSNETLNRRSFMRRAASGVAVASLTIYAPQASSSAAADRAAGRYGSDRSAAGICGDPRSDACLTCNQCTEACPNSVPVADLMRIRKYHDEYGWRDRARAEFKALGEDLPAVTARCQDCTVCGRVCPVGLADRLLVKDITSTFS